jgi:F420H(2)-dependent quinone reductase
MSVELTPNGTRGVKMPSVPRPLAKIMLRAVTWFMRLRGVHLLELTTVGSKSGKPHGVTLAYFPAGDQSWLVVASSSGAAKHPA